MPELSEVETVRAGLVSVLRLPVTIQRVTLRRPDLRWQIPPDLPAQFAGAHVEAITRRAKYLLWQTGHGVLLSHLGMTGSWRLSDGQAPGKHDHVVIDLADGRSLLYRDPRRFGALTWAPSDDDFAELKHLGPEPLGPHFTPVYLQGCCQGRQAPIKNVLMDNRVVVGVGNIYAAESLFRAGIDPRRAAGRISAHRLQHLHEAIVGILHAAIAAGGSTISDFRQAGGSTGYFQHNFQVYGREGEPCLRCAATLRHTTQAGRATVWCPQCQR